jgi:hypothetical protein
VAGASAEIAVEGLAQLTKTVRQAPKDVRLAYRKELRSLGEPIRLTAERLAESRIRNIGPRWGKFRTGVTQTSVYVAPRQKGPKTSERGGPSSRPRFGTLLAERATQPALKANRYRIEKDIERMLDRLCTKWNSEGLRRVA